MLCMTQASTNLLRAPNTPPVCVHRPATHQRSTPEEHPPQDPPAANTRDTPGPATSHPRDHPALLSPAKPAVNHQHNDMDALDLDSLPRQIPPDPGHLPLTSATISDPDLLRATLQGRALDTPLGWYRLQESWIKLTVKALRDLATPGKGVHEAIVDLVLWRASQHTQGQHIWIPPIELGQALTHDTNTNVTGRGTTRLRRAPAETDHPADPDHPEQWEQATEPIGTSPLCTAGLRTPDEDLAPLAYRQRPPPAGGLVHSPRARALLRSGRHSNVTRPSMGHQGDGHHARPRGRPTRGNRGPHHPAKGPQGRPPAGGPIPGPRPGPNHLEADRLPPRTGHALFVPVNQAPLAVHRDSALDLSHPHRPHTS